MGSFTGFRPMLRLELRQLLKHPARSALIVFLVAVPVAAMVGGSTLLLQARKSVEDQRNQAMGRAALRVFEGQAFTLEDAAQDLAAYPTIDSSERVHEGAVEVAVPGRKRRARLIGLDDHAFREDSLCFPMVRLQRGEAPGGPGEAALSKVLLESLEVDFGDEVQLDGRTVTVTGEAVVPEELDMPLALVTLSSVNVPGRPSMLIQVDDASASQLADSWRERGASVAVRDTTGSTDGFESFMILTGGTFGFFEASLVVAAAFGVSMRRRQREIGLLASNGAARPSMRLALIASAAALAAVGGAIGVATGAASARWLYPNLDGWLGRMVGPFEFPWFFAGIALALGIVSAIVAAALPAEGAVRLPIAVALSGRRPIQAGSGRFLVVASALILLGATALLVGAALRPPMMGIAIIVGSIVTAMGLGILSPWILERLAGLAAPLPVSWRLAIRDAGRFRVRNGPAVTAVMAGMSITVLFAAMLKSVEALSGVFEPGLRSDVVYIEGPAAEELSRDIAAALGGGTTAELGAAYRDGKLVQAAFSREGEERPVTTWLAAGSLDLLDAMDLGIVADYFTAGTLIGLSGDGADASLTLSYGESSTIDSPAYQMVAASELTRSPKAVISLEGLAALGCSLGPPPREKLSPWLVRTARPVTLEDIERAEALAASAPGCSVTAEILMRRPAASFFNVILWICIVTGLVVVFVATALSSVESAADARVLHTVGASPSLLRRHVAARASYLALLGCALAVPAGLAPMYGIQRIASSPLEFSMPWREIWITVLVMPAVAYAGTWFATLCRPPVEG